MSVSQRIVRRAFTLIELLVVVAIIALLISILLPSLKCAREKARAAKCGVQLKGLGTGLATYSTEENSWIPGVNTSGVQTRVAVSRRDKAMLRRAGTPVQSFDWMSPFLRYDTELGNNRAQRFGTLINEYRCPSFAGMKIDQPFPLNPGSMLDGEDFPISVILEYAPLSYLMPVHFQYWGQQWAGSAVATYLSASGRPTTLPAYVAPTEWEATHKGQYKSRLDMIGPPARKIAAADGLRYMDGDQNVDFNVDPSPPGDPFGAFTTSGGWWCGSQAYGVKNGTTNWDGAVVNSGSPSWPAAQGRALAWSYRHGCGGFGNLTQSVHDNTGEINALFFDGHIRRLDDRGSREIEYWYPTGTTVNHPNEGLTDVPVGTEIP